MLLSLAIRTEKEETLGVKTIQKCGILTILGEAPKLLSTGLLKVVKVTRALSGRGSLALSRDRHFSLLAGGTLFIIPRASGHTTAAAQVPGF